MITDFLTMFLISVAVAVFDDGISGDILLLLVLLGAVFGFYRFTLLFQPGRLGLILGAFLAGMLVSLLVIVT